ncbi:MAG: nucleotidyl transferase AbiEii/AbiGii toxin family protein [Planctomycetes bacterium]|nr:nucleotidyl transferase AbiEii/AbiGii toxin family protein [Planctomycetota bacterium]
MHDAIRSMLERYKCRSRDETINALREILQNLALLGLWRSKFFEHAAFYGGTALRVLHGLDRYSEDLDFSLLRPTPDFSLEGYGAALRREIGSFGFEVEFERRKKSRATAIESAFLKTNTLRELIRIEASEALLRGVHPGAQLKINLEVDIDPPDGFATEIRYLLQPIPFSVRAYSLPDLFAGKLHAVLFRKWGRRVKGRDWYDMVWFAGRHPRVSLTHLEQRMRQSGNWTEPQPLDVDSLRRLLLDAVARLDIDQARSEVLPFVRDRRALDVWSAEFFADVIGRITPAPRTTGEP